jgi:hypothetical protein
MHPPVDRARHRAPRRTLAAAIVTSLIAAVLFFSAAPASAASEADFVGTGQGMNIQGRIGGSGSWQSNWAGEMKIKLDGGSTVVGYCIDYLTSISTSSGTGLPEVDWATSGIPNLDKVSFILNTYSASSGALVGSADEKAAAVQAAIWHLTDGYDLRMSGGSANTGNLRSNYTTILESIPEGGLPIEPPPSLEVTPSSSLAPAGTPAGPFTVSTTATSVAVTAPAGTTVVKAGTNDEVSSLEHGDAFEVLYPGSNDPLVVGLQATASVQAGRVFAKFNADGTPAVQRLILGSSATATAKAEVEASWRTIDPGSLTVSKVIEGAVDENGDSIGSPDFDVRVTGPDGFDTTVTLSSPDYEATLDELAPGSYTVAELDPSPAPRSISYSSDGGVVVIDEGEGVSVTITNTYWNGAAPRAVLAAECGVGITGTLYNDGDLPTTFTLTIDGGDPQEITVDPGESKVLDTERATEVTVTGPGVDETISFDPDDCFELGTPTFSFACDLEGSTVTVTLEDLGELESDYDLYVDGELVDSFTGSFERTIPVTEGETYEIEVRSGDASLGSETYTVNCVSTEGFAYSRSCDAFTITLAAGEAELPARYTVEVTVDGVTSTEEYEVEPGAEPVVIEGSVSEGQEVGIVVSEETRGVLAQDSWVANCAVPPTPPPPMPPSSPTPSASVAGICVPLSVQVTLVSLGGPSPFDVFVDGELVASRESLRGSDTIAVALDGQDSASVRVVSGGTVVLEQVVAFTDCSDVGGEQAERPDDPPAIGVDDTSVAGGQLPRTGAESLPLVVAALMFGLLGAVLVVVSGSRRLVRQRS